MVDGHKVQHVVPAEETRLEITPFLQRRARLHLKAQHHRPQLRHDTSSGRIYSARTDEYHGTPFSRIRKGVIYGRSLTIAMAKATVVSFSVPVKVKVGAN